MKILIIILAIIFGVVVAFCCTAGAILVIIELREARERQKMKKWEDHRKYIVQTRRRLHEAEMRGEDVDEFHPRLDLKLPDEL